jgi:hypothetical protein
MLWVVRPDLQDPGDPEVLVPFHGSLWGVLSSHVYKVVVLVHLALDYGLIISIPAHSTGARSNSLMKLLYFFITSHSSHGVTV